MVISMVTRGGVESQSKQSSTPSSREKASSLDRHTHTHTQRREESPLDGCGYHCNVSPRPVRCLVAGFGQEDRDVFGSGVMEGGEEQGEQAGLQCRQLPPRGTVE